VDGPFRSQAFSFDYESEAILDIIGLNNTVLAGALAVLCYLKQAAAERATADGAALNTKPPGEIVYKLPVNNGL